jgi:lipopolysaccharide/colanic/teichoic acid biosynthesis glycosyltransferase
METRRTLNLFAAAAAGTALSPLLAGAALAVRAAMGRPVLFRQRRVGKAGRIFTLYKFRTMRDATDQDGRVLPDGQRLTRLGRFLRATSLDELPQLWNVIRGDMNLVGPRPLLPEYTERYGAFERRRLEVKPGITGWAQVHGRNNTTWERRFLLDVWYVDHQSLWLDLKILLLTAARLPGLGGISQPGHDTMPEFIGSAPGRNQAAENIEERAC